MCVMKSLILATPLHIYTAIGKIYENSLLQISFVGQIELTVS